MEVRNLYVHVPFCKTRCDYCAFYSTLSNDLQESWLQAIIRHLDYYCTHFSISSLETLYIGGGSPSCLRDPIFDALCQVLNGLVQDATEWTIELNPADLHNGLIANIQKYPITRISAGIETFNDKLRAAIHRRGSRDSIISALRQIQDLKHISLSLDLMYGFPGQNIAIVQDDLAIALGLKPEHISYYELILEPGTPLHDRIAKQHDSQEEQEVQASIWELINTTLKTFGYKRYEVSNWALPGHESMHNMNYWRLGSWLALGPSAVSNILTDSGYRRWTNVSDVSAYSRDFSLSDEETVQGKNAVLDYVMMNLRKKQGIDANEFTTLFHDSATLILSFLQTTYPNYFLYDRQYLRVNDGGLDHLNPVMIALMSFLEKTTNA